MTLLRVARRLLALPGRLLIHAINRARAGNRAPALTRVQRGAAHVFVGFCALIAFSTALHPAPVTASAAPVSVQRPPAARTSQPMPRSPASSTAETGGLTITRVIDGDTFELSDGATIRPLGIDSCEMNTPGGQAAKNSARVFEGGTVALAVEPGVDKDRYGRLLRYVQTSSGDFGEYMIRYDHTGVYQGHNDASPEYVARMYAHDLDFAANPPTGRECGSNPPEANDGPVYVPLPDNDDDHHRKPKICYRKWWC